MSKGLLDELSDVLVPSARSPRERLGSWAIVKASTGESFIVDLDAAIYGVLARDSVSASAGDPKPVLSAVDRTVDRTLLIKAALQILGTPIFFPVGYTYLETVTLAPGSDPARGVLTGIGCARLVYPTGVYGIAAGIFIIPASVTLLYFFTDALLAQLATAIDSAEEMSRSVQRGSPRIQLAHEVPRA
jgi:hypothetical protein